MNEKYRGSAWKIMIGMMCIQAGTLGILMNCNGILFSAVIKDLGFRAGDLSLFYTIRSLITAFCVTTTTKLVFKNKANMVMSVLSLFLVLSYAAMFFYNSLWQFYISGFFAGLGMSCTMTVIPTVLNNWFKKRNGFVIGLTMSASGIAGALFSPVCSKIIVALGWRVTALIMALIGFVLIVLPCWFILVTNPEQVGEKPYGIDEMNTEVKIETAAEQPSVDRTQPLYIFILTLVVVIGPGSIIQFNQQLPTFAQTVGYTIETGALLTSLSMIGNLSGKLLLGTLADKFGVYKAVLVFLVFTSLSMAGFFAFSSIRAVLMASALLFGTTYAIGMTVPSLMYLDLYGKEEYRQKLASMQAANGFIGAFSSSLIPYIYDFTGSFRPVFVLGVFLCICAAFSVTYLRRYSLSGK
ncbi:MAG: MFS transporter [Solobacterium sp.]|nr:MFS transporter [Solobacterium sp.]